jgi:hypothetical protein
MSRGFMSPSSRRGQVKRFGLADPAHRMLFLQRGEIQFQKRLHARGRRRGVRPQFLADDRLELSQSLLCRHFILSARSLDAAAVDAGDFVACGVADFPSSGAFREGELGAAAGSGSVRSCGSRCRACLML